jgi:hypothetical protein
MAAKTGIPTLIDVAVRMCNLIQRFDGVIVAVSGGNPAVIAALAAAMAACDTLRAELVQLREYGD